MFARALTSRVVVPNRVFSRGFAEGTQRGGAATYGGGAGTSESAMKSSMGGSYGSGSSSMGTGAGTGGASGGTNWMNYLLVGVAAAIPLYYLYNKRGKIEGHAKETMLGKGSSNEFANSPEVGPPGSMKSMKTLAGEATSTTLQNFAPINGFNTNVTEILFPAGDRSMKPIKAYRYIRYLNNDMAQSVIYDSDDKNAKLIGVEFHITDKMYDGLPAEEKKLWHSHAYEVKSGAMTAPRLPETAERELMKQMVYTYGKAWNFWDTSKGDSLPVGMPKLLVTATQDGQIDSSFLNKDLSKKRSDL